MLHVNALAMLLRFIARRRWHIYVTFHCNWIFVDVIRSVGPAGPCMILLHDCRQMWKMSIKKRMRFGWRKSRFGCRQWAAVAERVLNTDLAYSHTHIFFFSKVNQLINAKAGTSGLIWTRVRRFKEKRREKLIAFAGLRIWSKIRFGKKKNWIIEHLRNKINLHDKSNGDVFLSCDSPLALLSSKCVRCDEKLISISLSLVEEKIHYQTLYFFISLSSWNCQEVYIGSSGWKLNGTNRINEIARKKCAKLAWRSMVLADLRKKMLAQLMDGSRGFCFFFI